MVRKKPMNRALFLKVRNLSTRKALRLMLLARLLLFLPMPVLPMLPLALPPQPLMLLGSRSLLWRRVLRKASMHLRHRWARSPSRKALLPQVLLLELVLQVPQLPWLFPPRLPLVRLPGLPLTPCVARL